jgi:hypothetical protein
MKGYKYIYLRGKRVYLHVLLIHTYVAIEDLRLFDSTFPNIDAIFPLIGKLYMHPSGF